MSVYMACPDCGFIAERANIPKTGENAPSGIEVRSFVTGDWIPLLVAILCCSNCRMTDIPGKFLSVQ